MARRMFSPAIVCQDTFIDMPTSTQAFYFQLGMNADDDGFISPKRIMRMVGAGEDDLKILIAKGFVIPFESGVIVIRHWKVNNLVRRDWYRATTYVLEKSLIKPNDSGTYNLVNETTPNSSTQVGSKEGNNKALFKIERPESLKHFSQVSDGSNGSPRRQNGNK